MTKETGPDWSTITYEFAARQSVGGGERGGSVGPVSSVAQPAVKFMWYDGVREGRPNAPYELLARAAAEAATGQRPRNSETSASPGAWDLILVGDEGLMLFNRGSVNWIINPAQRGESVADVPKTLPRVENEDAEWLAAIKGGPKALSSFDYAGPFTEMVLLGNLAVRLGKKITWNAELLKAENAPEADGLIRPEYRQGWELPVAKELLRIG